MQVKIIITTVAFMLTMVLLGFYTLLEQNRMADFTQARHGRQIEAGSELFANNCVSCHGINGKAEEGCTDPDTGSDTCVGRQLNFYGLLCGQNGTQTSQRMTQYGWAGGKAAFIEAAIAGGRPGGVMPTWGAQFGGPMQQNQVENLTQYVLNWESEALCSVQPFQFPWPEEMDGLPGVTPADIELEEGQVFDADVALPVSLPGDVARGEELYKGIYACTSCHNAPEANENGSGPSHNGYGATAASRVGEITMDGLTYASAEDYTYRAILYPGEYLAPQDDGTPYGNAMTVFSGDSRMNESPQDIADLVAYLLDQ